MNAPRFLRVLLAALPATGLVACDRQAGTSDEHETTVAARLFLPDGQPASGARIKIYAVADTSKTPQDLVFAAADGSVRLPTDLPAGEYNLVVTDGDGNGLVIDSLLSKGAGAPQLHSDTLRPLGVLTGRLQVEPQHSPRIAWVQILGVGLAANVDTAGFFRLEVPAGRITLAALTREEHYTPTFRTVRTIPDSTVDVGTVRLEYTGIPVVDGLTVTYDSLSGIATVRWNRATMKGVLGYKLQRSGSVSVSLDDLVDTIFFDTLYRPESLDRKPTTREYAVVATDSARNSGVAWRRVVLTAPSPWSVVRKGFRIDSLGMAPGNRCNLLDTLDGGLACISERRSGDQLWKLHRMDTAEVRFSRDGFDWTLLPIPAGSLRTVVWKGKIWVARGITSGEYATFINSEGNPIRDDYSGVVIKAPRYDGVRIETWSTSGVLERVDTVMDRKGAHLYRLVVVSDTLVLSRDSAADGAAGGTGPGGILPISLGLRNLTASEGAWSGEVLGHAPREWVLSYRALMNLIWYEDPFEKYADAVVSWQGLDWAMSGGGLLARRSGDIFPWKVTDGNLYGSIYVYRGNGEVAPPFVVWKGCALLWEYPGKLSGICPVD